MASSLLKTGYRKLSRDLTYFFMRSVPDTDSIRASELANIIARQNMCTLIRLDSIILTYRENVGNPLVSASDYDYLLRMLQIEYKLPITDLFQLSFKQVLIILSDRMTSEGLINGDYVDDFVSMENEVITELNESRLEIAQHSKTAPILPILDWNNIPNDILRWNLVY